MNNSSAQNTLTLFGGHTQQKLGDILMQAPAAIAIFKGQNHVLEFANPRYLALVSRKMEFVGRTVREIFPEPTKQRFIELLDAVFKSGKPFSGNEMVVTVKAENEEAVELYVNFVYQPFTNDKEKVEGIIVQAIDVTEQVEARKKVELEKEKYRTLFNFIDEAFCTIEVLFDENGKPFNCRFLEVNKAFEQQTGLMNMEGKTMNDFARIEEFWCQAYADVAITGKPARFESKAENPQRHYDVYTFKVGLPNERKVAVLFTDITKRKRAEEALQKSENYFRQLTDTLPAIIWITEPDGSCTYLNQHWYDYTGQKEHEAEGFGWLNAIHPDDRDRAGRIFLEANDIQNPFSLLYRLCTKDGDYRWCRNSGNPKFNRDGLFEGFIGTVVNVHDEKMAEEKIRESERFNRTTLESSPDCVKVLDQEGRLTYMNYNGTCTMEVDDFSVLKNKSWWDLWPDGSKTDVKNAVAKALKGETAQFQAFCPTAKGTPKWWDVMVSPIIGEDGSVAQLISVSRDITETRKAEQALKLSEVRFKAVIDQTPAPTLVLRGDEFRIEHINTPMLRMMGRGKEVIGHRMMDIMPELEGQFSWAEVQRVYREGSNFDLDEVLVPHNRTGVMQNYYYNVAYRPLTEEGRIVGMIQVAIDVTEQVTARKKLEESESRFRNLSDQAPMFIFIADENVNITYVNKALLSYVNLHFSEFTGHVWEKHVHPDDIAAMNETFTQAWQSRSPYQIEIRIRDAATGIYNWFLSTGIPRYEGETFKGFVGTGMNIQEQKELTEGLEQKVRERTGELGEANKDLHRSNEDLQQFAHVASHDLKEPVRKVLTFVSRLNSEFEGELPGKAKFYIGKIENAAQRSYDMIEGVLHYSSLNSKDQKREAVDLNTVLESILSDLEVVIVRKEANIQYDRLPVIEGYATLLYQLLYNLLANALKFTKPGTLPVISIRHAEVQGSEAGHEADKTIRYHRLTVTDNGIGFEQTDAEYIFQTFTRLNGKDQYEGSGMGLALCRKIAERHGGFIQAESEEGQGTAFRVFLPVDNN